MGRELQDKKTLGSPVRNAWDFIKPLLLSERGEAGSEEGDPGKGGEWDAAGELSPELDLEAEPKKIPEAKPDTKPPEEPEEPEPEGTKEKPPEEPEEPEPEGEEEEGEVEGEPSEADKKISTLEAEIANLETQSKFYQTQLNEALGQGQPEGEQEAGQPVRQEPLPAGELPEGVKKPGDWDNQDQMAQYFDHRAGEAASQAIQDWASDTKNPLFNRINSVITALQDTVVKIGRDDFDEVAKATWNDVFTMDPETNKVISVKNEGLLKYLQAQPFPQLAAYEYGLRKQAPEKIKKGVQKATKKTLEGLEKKPKKVTQPKTGKAAEGKVDLGWDASGKEVEDYLDKENLI